jgi:hypothetical protein
VAGFDGEVERYGASTAGYPWFDEAMIRPITRWNRDGLVSFSTANGMAHPFPTLPPKGHDESSPFKIEVLEICAVNTATIAVHFDFNLLATSFDGFNGLFH